MKYMYTVLNEEFQDQRGEKLCATFKLSKHPEVSYNTRILNV